MKEVWNDNLDENNRMNRLQQGVPKWNEKHLRFAIEGAGVALWAWNVDTDKLLLDQRAYDMWGCLEPQT